jgi:hypothetical protein
MFERGDLVDGESFRERNLRGLVDRRYLTPATGQMEDPTAKAQDAPRGVPVSAQAKRSQDTPKRRGRPPGSKNKASGATSEAGA